MKYSIIGIHDAGGVTRAWLSLECGKACNIPMRKGEALKHDDRHIWGWDGKEVMPTVTPSIACSECLFHKTLIKGVWE